MSDKDFNYRRAIQELVNTSNAIKLVDLSLRVMEDVGPGIFNLDTFNFELLRLIRDGEILELEYTVPSMPYRTKSIYMPKGTKIEGFLK